VFTLAVLSLKGGVGKTTVTLGMAGAAAVRGLRTLVVDLDPQANATLALDVAADGPTVADVFDKPSIQTVLDHARVEAVHHDTQRLEGRVERPLLLHRPKGPVRAVHREEAGLGHHQRPLRGHQGAAGQPTQRRRTVHQHDVVRLGQRGQTLGQHVELRARRVR
jgi:hypothetical protein